MIKRVPIKAKPNEKYQFRPQLLFQWTKISSKIYSSKVFCHFSVDFLGYSGSCDSQYCIRSFVTGKATMISVVIFTAKDHYAYNYPSYKFTCLVGDAYIFTDSYDLQRMCMM
jgi:hypothetical protein